MVMASLIIWSDTGLSALYFLTTIISGNSSVQATSLHHNQGEHAVCIDVKFRLVRQLLYVL